MQKTLMTTLLTTLLLTSTVCVGHDAPEVPKPMALDELMQAFGWNFEETEITTQKIAKDFYVLFGAGGNIGVSVGDDGVFIVDDQFPQVMPKIKTAINKLGGEAIDFAVTTHWHFDHAEGNLALGQEGTWLVAHENSRRMMQDDHLINLVVLSYLQKAYPESALPDITFDDDMQFHFNGQQIDLLHFGPAHTTGDTGVFFRGVNAVHLGDVYNNSGYPFIDAGNGGSLAGVINFCAETLKRIDKDTVVIPGHGPVVGYQELVDYVDMLTTIQRRILALIAEGASLEAVYQAKPTGEYDKVKGDNTGFINRAYMSLTHKAGTFQ